MREYVFDLTETLSNGMEIGRFKDNSAYLVNAHNWEIYKDGLRTATVPDLFTTECEAFFTVNGEQVILKEDQISVGAVTQAITPAGLWNYVWREDFFLASNGAEVWQFDNDGLGLADGSAVQPSLCLTEFEGQIIAANFQPSANQFFSDWRPNTVAWSGIMDLDFRVDLKNTAGYTHLSGASEIIALHRVGGAVYAFAPEGIWRLTPQSSPTTTYGVTKISGLPVEFQQHVAGDSIRCYFISGSELYILSDGAPVKLGYSEYITMFNTDVRLTYDPTEEILHWNKGSFNYALSNNGLSELSYFPACFGMTPSGRAAYLEGSSDVTTRYLETSVITLNYPGVKTITSVECDFAGSMTGEILTRTARDATWKSSGQIPFNLDGTIGKPITGNMFRIILRGGDEIHALRVRYKSSDRRFVRGTVQADAITS